MVVIGGVIVVGVVVVVGVIGVGFTGGLKLYLQEYELVLNGRRILDGIRDECERLPGCWVGWCILTVSTTCKMQMEKSIKLTRKALWVSDFSYVELVKATKLGF